MNNLCGNLVNHIYDYSIGDDLCWRSQLKNVVHEIKYFNVDDIVSAYSSNNHVRQDLDSGIISCWF